MSASARRLQRALDAARSGALGAITSVDVFDGATYPTYEGGPLPAWYRDAGQPFRDAGARGLALIADVLGDIEEVAVVRSGGGDPHLAFDTWRATVKCARGIGRLELAFGAKRPRSQLVIYGTKGVRRVPLPDTFDGTIPASIASRVEAIARDAEADVAAQLAKFPLSERVPYLVTGASGALGKAVLARLRAGGHRVRAFQRRVPASPADGVEYAFGDLGDPAAVDRAVAGAEVVVHCGAAMKGGWLEHRAGTVVGTANVVAACRAHRVKQLVHISSMSVIDWAGSADQGAVTEACALEPRPGERGAYTRAKLEAEQLVVAAARQGLPAVILRPGQIFGGGIPLINGAVARRAAGRWLVLGDGKLELPLVYLDDVVDAVLAAIDKRLAGGEVIHVIDPEHLTQDDVLGLAGGARPTLRVPRALVFALGKLSELPLRAVGRQSPVALYRMKSALARLHYDSDRARGLLGWQPRVGVREGIERELGKVV